MLHSSTLQSLENGYFGWIRIVSKSKTRVFFYTLQENLYENISHQNCSRSKKNKFKIKFQFTLVEVRNMLKSCNITLGQNIQSKRIDKLQE